MASDPLVLALQQDHMVTYLLDRKFGRAVRAGGVSISLSADRMSRKPGQTNGLETYKAELLAKPVAELKAMFDAEKAREAQLEKLRFENEERARPFNRPNAHADFVHWSKAAYWTLDEAIALSFGRAPEVVKWESIQKSVSVSTFANQYARLRDLATRAKISKQLFDPVSPGIYIAWAKRMDVAFPLELEAAVVARGNQVADWRTLFEKVNAQLETERASSKKFSEAAQETVEIHKKTIAAFTENQKLLLQRISQLEKEQANYPQEKGLATRERESLLKMIIGMAVGGYAHDPNAHRTATAAEIATDLHKAGIEPGRRYGSQMVEGFHRSLARERNRIASGYAEFGLAQTEFGHRSIRTI